MHSRTRLIRFLRICYPALFAVVVVCVAASVLALAAQFVYGWFLMDEREYKHSPLSDLHSRVMIYGAIIGLGSAVGALAADLRAQALESREHEDSGDTQSGGHS